MNKYWTTFPQVSVNLWFPVALAKEFPIIAITKFKSYDFVFEASSAWINFRSGGFELVSL